MAWHNVRVRGDLYEILRAQAAEQSRSVAGQVDHLLTRALEQEPGSGGRSPVPARASNTSASSGGGPSSGVIPGESGRGAGVGRGETDTGDARTREPADPAPLDSYEINGLRETVKAQQLEGQTDIYEMLGACPECAGKMVQVAGVESCEDCGFTRDVIDAYNARQA
jgi:hypothetical protein